MEAAHLWNISNVLGKRQGVSGMLAEVAHLKTVRLTTVGRKSGQRRSTEVWFVAEDDAVLIQAGAQGQKGWYRNVAANPNVELAFGTWVVEGVAEVLSGVDEEAVAAEFRRKYWLARVARLFGSQIGRGKPVRVRLLTDAATAA